MALAALVAPLWGFAPSRLVSRSSSRSSRRASSTLLSMEREDFEFEFNMPQKGITEFGIAQVKLPPVLEKSEIKVVRYSLPFGLDAQPETVDDKPQVVVTKDGAGGEKVGDILRQTTCWRGSTPALFDVSKSAGDFNTVVGALVSNDLTVTDE